MQLFKDVTFWEFLYTEYKPKSAEVEREVSLVKPGLEFYLVQVYWENTGKTRLDAQTHLGRTNLGRKELVRGYLGSTDNIGRYARGHWRLVSAIDRGGGYYDIEAEEVSCNP